MAEKSFKYIILGGGVSAVSIFFLPPKIMEFRFSVITFDFLERACFDLCCDITTILVVSFWPGDRYCEIDSDS